MDSLIKADIFFFIATIAIIVVTLVFLLVLFYAFRVLKDVKDFVSAVKKEGEEIVKDISKVRGTITGKLMYLAEILSSIRFIQKKRKTTRKSTKHIDSEIGEDN